METSLSLYDFALPPERIAQYPSQRGRSRLFVIQRDGSFLHGSFSDIPDYFEPGDVLIVNDTRVLRARLLGKTPSGGRVEILFTKANEAKRFRAIVRPGKRFKPGTRIAVEDEVLVVLSRDGRLAELEIESGNDVIMLLEKHGRVPLPPYIKRPPEPDDEKRYQTVFAREPGSVAAPTAGLHFTEEILERIRAKGTKIANITLHVGPGTFNPIEALDLKEHNMEAEYYTIPKETAEAIREAKSKGRRVFVCGTSSARATETWAMGRGTLAGWTDLFIYPGHEFRVPSALITNLHLPKSTPLALVAAFCGRELILEAYKEALKMGYMFGSYGDAMLVLYRVAPGKNRLLEF